MTLTNEGRVDRLKTYNELSKKDKIEELTAQIAYDIALTVYHELEMQSLCVADLYRASDALDDLFSFPSLLISQDQQQSELKKLAKQIEKESKKLKKSLALMNKTLEKVFEKDCV